MKIQLFWILFFFQFNHIKVLSSITILVCIYIFSEETPRVLMCFYGSVYRVNQILLSYNKGNVCQQESTEDKRPAKSKRVQRTKNHPPIRFHLTEVNLTNTWFGEFKRVGNIKNRILKSTNTKFFCQMNRRNRKKKANNCKFIVTFEI